MTVLWVFFLQILLSYSKLLMLRPLKWVILGAGTIILSGDIQNYILCMVRIFINQTLIGKGLAAISNNYDSLLCLPCVWIMNFHSYFGNSITTVHCGGYNKRLNLWGLDFTFVFYIIAMKTHIPIWGTLTQPLAITLAVKAKKAENCEKY